MKSRIRRGPKEPMSQLYNPKIGHENAYNWIKEAFRSLGNKATFTVLLTEINKSHKMSRKALNKHLCEVDPDKIIKIIIKNKPTEYHLIEGYSEYDLWEKTAALTASKLPTLREYKTMDVKKRRSDILRTLEGLRQAYVLRAFLFDTSRNTDNDLQRARRLKKLENKLREIFREKYKNAEELDPKLVQEYAMYVINRYEM